MIAARHAIDNNDDYARARRVVARAPLYAARCAVVLRHDMRVMRRAARARAQQHIIDFHGARRHARLLCAPRRAPAHRYARAAIAYAPRYAARHACHRQQQRQCAAPLTAKAQCALRYARYAIYIYMRTRARQHDTPRENIYHDDVERRD